MRKPALNLTFLKLSELELNITSINSWVNNEYFQINCHNQYSYSTQSYQILHKQKVLKIISKHHTQDSRRMNMK